MMKPRFDSISKQLGKSLSRSGSGGLGEAAFATMGTGSQAKTVGAKILCAKILGNLSVRVRDVGVDRDKPLPDCEQYKVGIAVQFELGHDVMFVKFDRF